MLAVSIVVQLVAHAKARVIVRVSTRMEINMKTTIYSICVAAGTALLGRSGDMFPTLQGNACTNLTLAV